MPMIAPSKWTLVAALLLVLPPAACDRSPIYPDQELMRRWAEELDRDASRLRSHIGTIRQLAPEQWHARMDEHVGLVTGVLDRMDRRMDEMRQMDGAAMRSLESGMMMGGLGWMMGMGAEGHEEMLDLMDVLRADMERLRAAAPAEVVERMPGHLDRLEDMARMMEHGAAHMRFMLRRGGVR